MKKKSVTEKLFSFSFKTAAKAAYRRQRPFCSVILAAAGSSVRMGKNKLVMELCGKPVILYSLQALECCDEVDEVIVVAGDEIRAKVHALCEVNGISKVKAVVPGGQTRVQSVAEGLKYVSDKAQLIAVHDAARPVADSEFISSVVCAAKGKVGVIPVVPVKDTIKIVEGNKIVSTPERSKLFGAQTPQVFDADVYRAAAAAYAGDETITDDCMMIEKFGSVVETVPGDEDNLKLTTIHDAAVAELILRKRSGK